MEQLRQLWMKSNAVYAKLPEIIRFVLAMLWILFIGAIAAKGAGMIGGQLSKMAWVQHVAQYFDKVGVYLPFALIAVLFLMAFNRIAELLKK